MLNYLPVIIHTEEAPAPEDPHAIVEVETPRPDSGSTPNEKKRGCLVFLRSILLAGREDGKEELDRKRTKPLPHWLIYIAHLLVFVTSVVCALFVCLYGFSFGKNLSDKWTVSMIFSLLLSLFIFQPAKVRKYKFMCFCWLINCLLLFVIVCLYCLSLLFLDFYFD